MNSIRIINCRAEIQTLDLQNINRLIVTFGIRFLNVDCNKVAMLGCM